MKIIITKQHPISFKEEQNNGDGIRQVRQWKNELAPSAKSRKNFFKQINQLRIEDENLYRFLYVDVRKTEFKQYCLQEHLWKEMILYQRHNSQTTGQI